jgi:hypothetical protein
MKLRQRFIIREKYDDLCASDESSEDDSDESDNWVMPKSRKNRSIKRRKINPVHLNSFKKEHTSEAVRHCSYSSHTHFFFSSLLQLLYLLP